MKLEQLNFHHLFYFWRVARSGHLTRTADELRTSQSAVLADPPAGAGIGEKLFTREGRRLLFTDSGQMVLAYADNIFGLGQEMLGRLQGRTAGITRLRVGSVATLSARNYQENWIRPLLSNASLVLTLESGLLEGLIARLVQHQLDVVLANETVPAESRAALALSLSRQAIHRAGRTRGALAWANAARAADLDGLDIALPGPRHALRTQFDALCATAGVTPKLRAEVDDMAMLRLIARDSGWLTVLPEVVVQDELVAGSLVRVGHSAGLQERFTPSPRRTVCVSRCWTGCCPPHRWRSMGERSRDACGWVCRRDLLNDS